MRQRRRNLGVEQRRAAATQMARRVARSAVFLRSRHIVCYFPNDGELDPTPLMQIAWSMSKVCYLPVLDALHPARLWFTPYYPDGKLVPNRFGIPEPLAVARRKVQPWRLDLILVPLVAFDDHGNRLGMGKGFYDRTLSFLHRRQHWKKPRLLGIAYDFQRVANLPVDPWDVPLYGIATETGFYTSDTAGRFASGR